MAQNSHDSQPDTSWYRDEKGRKRWHSNDEVAVIVKQPGEYLIIAIEAEKSTNSPVEPLQQ